MDYYRHLYVVGKDQYDLAKFGGLYALGECDRLTYVNNKDKGDPPAKIAMRATYENVGRTVIGLVHADVYFHEGDLQKCFDAAYNRYQIVGIVGRKDANRNHWGSQGGSYVSTLDCCSIFWDNSTPIYFDPDEFDGFHLFVEDACLTVKERHNIPSFVPHLSQFISHEGGSTYEPGWQADYARYKERLIKKHPGYLTTYWTTGEPHEE